MRERDGRIPGDPRPTARRPTVVSRFALGSNARASGGRATPETTRDSPTHARRRSGQRRRLLCVRGGDGRRNNVPQPTLRFVLTVAGASARDHTPDLRSGGMPRIRLVWILVLTLTCFGRPALAQIVPRVRTVDPLIVDALDFCRSAASSAPRYRPCSTIRQRAKARTSAGVSCVAGLDRSATAD